VATWLEHWLTTIAPRRIRQRTLESYESAVRTHLIPGIGRHRIDRLRPEHLDQLYTDLLDAGYSPATVLRHHRILSRALTLASSAGTSRVTSPHSSVRPPAPGRHRHRAEPGRDARRARGRGFRPQLRPLDRCPHPRAAAVGGPGAVVEGRRPARQHPDGPSQHSPRSGGGLIYEEPKSKRSYRTLALPLPLVAELLRQKAVQLGERMLAGSEWHDEDLVFAQPNGRPIDKKSDYDDWRASAAVRRRPPRPSARRLPTAATLLQSENVHPRVVMELLGHSQMRTTMDIYSHVMPALAREAADRMGTVLLIRPASTATTTAPETTQAASRRRTACSIGWT
jgi:integrase